MSTTHDCACLHCAYFGICPKCGNCEHAQIMSIGRDHWSYCREHRVRWRVNSNLLDSWPQRETEEERRAVYVEPDFGGYRTLESSEVLVFPERAASTPIVSTHTPSRSGPAEEWT